MDVGVVDAERRAGSVLLEDMLKQCDSESRDRMKKRIANKECRESQATDSHATGDLKREIRDRISEESTIQAKDIVSKIAGQLSGGP